MNFRKLGKKLSAILCSSMMFGGSSVSDRVAMAGGVRVSNWYDVRKFGIKNYAFSFISLADNFRDIARQESFSYGDDEDDLKLDHSYYFEIDSRKIGLHSMGVEGFAVSVDKGTDKEIKCGIFPFCYFCHCMDKEGVRAGDFKPFDEMTSEVKVKFLRGLGKGFFGADYGENKVEINGVEDFVKLINDRVAPDGKKFWEREDVKEGDKQPISVLGIDAFEKAEPMYSDGERVVYNKEFGLFLAEEKKDEMRIPRDEMDFEMKIEANKSGEPIGALVRRRRRKNSKKLVASLSVIGGAFLLGGGIGIPLVVRSKSTKNGKINTEKLSSRSRAVLSNPSQIGKNENRITKTMGQGKPKNVMVSKQMKSKRIRTN